MIAKEEPATSGQQTLDINAKVPQLPVVRYRINFQTFETEKFLLHSGGTWGPFVHPQKLTISSTRKLVCQIPLLYRSSNNFFM